MAELGFGIMRFRNKCAIDDNNEIKSIIDEYMKGKFCYFDLHPAYSDGKSQQIFRQFVSDRYTRDKYLVANKMPYYGISTYEDYEKIFDGELVACGVTYFDYYLLHCITQLQYEYHEKYGGFKYLYYLKNSGLAKKIGFSFHGSSALLKEILSKYDFVDFVQLQINFLDWESDTIRSKELYEIARSYNKEILVMEPIKGGTLSKKINVDITTYSASEMADISLRFVLGLPGISVVLSGMTERMHVINNRKSLAKESLPYDYFKNIIRSITSIGNISCTKCGYCKRACKCNIDIPSVIEAINESMTVSGEGVSRFWVGRMYYDNMLNTEGAPSKCVSCGQCEKICPQKLPIKFFVGLANTTLCNENVNIVKSQLELLHHSMRLQDMLCKLGNDYNIYAYGAGEKFKGVAKKMSQYNLFTAVIDADECKHGAVIEGVRCVNIKEVPQNALILITIENENIVKNVMKMLDAIGYKYVDLYWNWDIFYRIKNKMKWSSCYAEF